MSKRKTSLLMAGILLLLSLSVPLVLAQDYRFSVDENISHVYINQDGSVDVEHYLTFMRTDSASLTFCTLGTDSASFTLVCI